MLDRATAFVSPTVSVGFDLGKIGYFKAAKMYLEFRRLRDNPDDRPLSDVVPADLYARFSELHARFDTDLALARERAIAWAEGDVDALHAGAKRSSLDACLEGFADTMQVAGKMRDARWGRLVEAVEDHAVSLAVVEVDSFARRLFSSVLTFGLDFIPFDENIVKCSV